MATLPIHLEVEDVAVGPVLIALRRMPGIIKMHLDVLSGAPPPAPLRGNGEAKANMQTAIVALLLKQQDGLNRRDIAKLLGERVHRVSPALTGLRQKHVVLRDDNRSWSLTDAARKSMNATDDVKLLAAPAKTNGHRNGGKLPRGEARLYFLKAIGNDGPTGLSDICAKSGLGAKSCQGVVSRALRDKLITRKGIGIYEISAAGRKLVESQSAANGV